MSVIPIPSMLLRQLYTFNSLENVAGGVQFAIKNRLNDAKFSRLDFIKIDGKNVPKSALAIILNNGRVMKPDDISSDKPIEFPLREILTIKLVLTLCLWANTRLKLASAACLLAS